MAYHDPDHITLLNIASVLFYYVHNFFSLLPCFSLGLSIIFQKSFSRKGITHSCSKMRALACKRTILLIRIGFLYFIFASLVRVRLHVNVMT